MDAIARSSLLDEEVPPPQPVARKPMEKISKIGIIFLRRLKITPYSYLRGCRDIIQMTVRDAQRQMADDPIGIIAYRCVVHAKISHTTLGFCPLGGLASEQEIPEWIDMDKS